MFVYWLWDLCFMYIKGSCSRLGCRSTVILGVWLMSLSCMKAFVPPLFGEVYK